MGEVALIGAGPGAEDLITVRGLRLLQAADCVLHDALVSPALLAHARPDARLIDVGKRCGRRSSAQTFINRLLVVAARRYALVVRLKGGDPGIFGRADEEITALRAAGIAVSIVPGITAATAAAASLRCSLTLRGVARSFAVATPAIGAGENDWHPGQQTVSADSLAIYMGLRQSRRWAEHLLAGGRDPATPVILCENVSCPEERFTPLTLGELPSFSPAQLGDGPCLTLLGWAFAAACRELAGGNPLALRLAAA